MTRPTHRRLFIAGFVAILALVDVAISATAPAKTPVSPPLVPQGQTGKRRPRMRNWRAERKNRAKPPAGVPAQNWLDSGPFERRVNEYRVANGRISLGPNQGLRDGSSLWSWDMARNGFRHAPDLPPGTGENIFYAWGYYRTCADAANNLEAVSQQAFDSFRNSPGHNSNMLSTWWHSQGAGIVCVDTSQGATIYVTSRFAV